LLSLLIVVLLFPLVLIKTKKEKTNQSKPLREPAVAGSFYPDNPQELDELINNFLNQSKTSQEKAISQKKTTSSEEKLQTLIVPHAGLNYSGQTAAAGFKQIQGKNYSRIILLGASHRFSFNHAAVFNQGSWQTPLGQTKIDEDLAKKLIDEKKKIIPDLKNHQEEHSLEVELVFLQKVLADFQIVPILLSQADDQLINDLAAKISENLDEKTLLVVSSDLSHYPPYQIANETDKQIIEAILSNKQEDFKRTVNQIESQNYPQLETAACAKKAIEVALKVAELKKIKFREIKYENSGDVTGDKNRVVGYAALGGWGEKETEIEIKASNLKSQPAKPLDSQSQKEALLIVRQTLEKYLENREIPNLIPKSKNLQQSLGAFVTLRNNGSLRGCIGEFEPEEPLFKVIQRMAINAATKDSRFLPVSLKELKGITVEISVLTPKKKIKDWQKIQLGKHGVVIQKSYQGGTFLPQVAEETGWDLEEFLNQLCQQKAGLPKNCYQDPKTNLYTFEAQVFEEE